MWFFISQAAIKPFGTHFKLIPLPLYELEHVALTTKPDIAIRNINDLNNYHIALIRQSVGIQTLLKDIHPKSVQYAVDQRQLLKMLKAGRFEVAVTSEILLKPLSKQLGFTQLFVHRPPGLRVPLYAAVRHDCSCYEPLSKALKQAVNSGEWAHAIQREIAQLNTRP